GDETLMPQRIKESLVRIAGETASTGVITERVGPLGRASPVRDPELRSRSAKKSWQTRRAKKSDSSYDEDHHVAGKPQEAVQLYRAIERLCFSFAPSDVVRRYWAKSINYEYGKVCFCSVHVLQGGLRVWLKLKYAHIANPPTFARDVSNIGHWGSGDVELRISNRSELDAATDLIRRSFETIEK
ncbi:MAG: DUF5655 domain-containing protein, partial [Planctomycetes bacterium]|nr:DUF5655 domain-containing protein [Planctomycetota bacterium]